jgi:hypothetical protein
MTACVLALLPLPGLLVTLSVENSLGVSILPGRNAPWGLCLGLLLPTGLGVLLGGCLLTAALGDQRRMRAGKMHTEGLTAAVASWFWAAAAIGGGIACAGLLVLLSLMALTW